MIYIVDDDESVRNSLTRLMRSAGLAARAFAGAEELLGQPGGLDPPDPADPPDPSGACACAIVDVHMPGGMDGLELQRFLAGHAPPIPVILITARDDPAVRERAFAAGAAAFLKKPFDDLALLRAVAEATRGRGRGGAACDAPAQSVNGGGAVDPRAGGSA
jgi:FixJ family two-component response regulator